MARTRKDHRPVQVFLSESRSLIADRKSLLMEMRRSSLYSSCDYDELDMQLRTFERDRPVRDENDVSYPQIGVHVGQHTWPCVENHKWQRCNDSRGNYHRSSSDELESP